MNKNRLVLAALAAVLATAALAQPATQLPPTLSGRWTAQGATTPVIDRFSIAFDGERSPGSVPGKLTWRGFNCGAKDEPIQAQWDGTELKFEAMLRPDTNTQRMGGKCPGEPGKWVLKRKADQSFEGEGRLGNVVVTVTAAP